MSGQITEEARRAASIAVAVEINSWPGDAGLPYHPTDPTAADTMRRITDVALDAVVPLLAPQPTLPVCPNCEGEHFTCGACGIVLDATVTRQPVVDREAIDKVLRVHGIGQWGGELSAGRDFLVTALLALLAGSAK